MLRQTGLKKTAPNLTTNNFIKTMESSTFPRDMFGGPEYTFTPTKRLGNDKSRIGQIQNGRWVALTRLSGRPVTC